MGFSSCLQAVWISNRAAGRSRELQGPTLESLSNFDSIAANTEKRSSIAVMVR